MIKVSSCKKLFPANKTLYFSTEKRWRWGHSSVKVTIGNLKRISWRQMTWKHLCHCFYYFITWFWSNWGQTLMWGRSPAVFQLHSGLFSSFIPDSFWLHFILCDCDSRSPHLCTIFSGRTKRWMDKSLLSVSWSALPPRRRRRRSGRQSGALTGNSDVWTKEFVTLTNLRDLH